MVWAYTPGKWHGKRREGHGDRTYAGHWEIDKGVKVKGRDGFRRPEVWAYTPGNGELQRRKGHGDRQ